MDIKCGTAMRKARVGMDMGFYGSFKERDNILIGKLITGEEIHKYEKSIVVNFIGSRKVLSTARRNGGQRDDQTAVYNNDCIVGTGMAPAAC